MRPSSLVEQIREAKGSHSLRPVDDYKKQNKHIHISYSLCKPGEGKKKTNQKNLVITNVLKSIRLPVKNC